MPAFDSVRAAILVLETKQALVAGIPTGAPFPVRAVKTRLHSPPPPPPPSPAHSDRVARGFREELFFLSQITDFAALGLAPELLRAIADAGYTQPTPIQAQAIPPVLAGVDLLAAAQTGTGKTAGFTLPILQRLSSPTASPATAQPSGRPRCLILTPTRELAAQVEESVRTYGKYLAMRSMVMFGGVGMQPQVDALRRRLDILVATPGRLLDHVGQRTLDLSGVEIFVLDEADRMLDMGFIRDIRRVLTLLPAKRQNLLFSATFSQEIRTLAHGLLNAPREVSVTPRNTTTELVDQSVYLIDRAAKPGLLSHLIRTQHWKQVLVFTRTKHGANRLAERLERDGIAAMAIHGNKSQTARTRALAGFKEGSVPVLVATDIAARGLDIDQLPQVVNFELPNVPEDYVHRIGRTGRAGRPGAAVSLVEPEELKLLVGIERLIGKRIERAAKVEGFVAPTGAAAAAELRDDRPPLPPRRPAGGSRAGPRAGPNGAANAGPRPGSHPAAGRGPRPAPRAPR
jgi:ATP-dependent RNA helicase RhlE